MTDRAILEPSREHPLSVRPTEGHVTVHVNGQQVAATSNALTLTESTYPAVQYIPRQDIDAGVLEDSTTTTYCPYKGDASYFNVATETGTVEDAVWTYNEPFPAVAAIRNHVAFYTDRAEVAVSRR